MEEMIVLGKEARKGSGGWYTISSAEPYVLDTNNFKVTKDNEIICLSNGHKIEDACYYQVSIDKGYHRYETILMELIPLNKDTADCKFTKKCSEELFKLQGKKMVISSVKLCSGPNRPDDMIKNVVFNEEKGTTTVIWKDDEVTTVRCNEGDTFNKEAGIALCYMKRVMANRSCFNEVFRKWC